MENGSASEMVEMRLKEYRESEGRFSEVNCRVNSIDNVLLAKRGWIEGDYIRFFCKYDADYGYVKVYVND